MLELYRILNEKRGRTCDDEFNNSSRREVHGNNETMPPTIQSTSSLKCRRSLGDCVMSFFLLCLYSET